MIQKNFRLKIELAIATTIGIAGVIAGTAYTNPSGWQKPALIALGSAATGFTVAKVLSGINDRTGILEREITALKLESGALQKKIDKEYQDAKSLLETIEQLQTAIALHDFQDSERQTTYDDLWSKAEQWRNAAHDCSTIAKRLKAELDAAHDELAQVEQNHKEAIAQLEKRHGEKIHKQVKAQVTAKAQKAYANYKTQFEALTAENQAQHEIELERYQSRIEELTVALNQLQAQLEATGSEKTQLTNAFEELTQKDLPDIQQTFEQEWLKNDQLLQSAIEQLQRANAELQQPRQFSGLTNIDSIGNKIISHFFAYGVVLDAIESVSIPAGFRLRFKFDRTEKFTSLSESEFDKRCNEPGLMGLSYTPLDFVFDARNFIVSVDIRTEPPAAKGEATVNNKAATVANPDADFYRAQNLLPASEFAKVYTMILDTKDVPSVRVNGETGSGKSSVVRLLLSEGLKAGKTRIRLHDPQAGSAEDRWGIPPTSKTADATSEAMTALLGRVERKEAPPINTIDVFDEIDSAMRKDEGMKKAYLSAMTQVRHLANQRMIVIGQNPGAGRGGLQWADMDNCGSIYIGDSALIAIKGSPKLSNKKAILEKQFTAIQDFCQGRNEANVLDGSEPNAFRFALVSLPRKAAFWIELPQFSSGVEPIGNLVVGTVAANPAHACPHCGSDELKVNKQLKTGTQFRCKSCSKCHTIKATQSATKLQ